MSVICKPAVDLPEHTLSGDEALAVCRAIHNNHPKLAQVLKLIENTGVQKRHFIQPLEDCLQHPGVEARIGIFEREAKLRVPGVVEQALENAEVETQDVDVIIFVSCTGFTMPSLTAWMINALGFRRDVRQLPVAQMGCAGGAFALNMADSYCRAYPTENVLVVTCEFCSLCYQPTDLEVGSLLSAGLFGDAVAAVVVRGEGGTGPQVLHTGSYLMPDSTDWISYAVKDTGFHFQLDKRVPGTMQPLAPVLNAFVKEHDEDPSNLGFYVIHAGGPRILDDLSIHMGVPRDCFRYSWQTLTNSGNIASAVVLDVLRRVFEDPHPADGSVGLIAGFGPGITAEFALCRWAS